MTNDPTWNVPPTTAATDPEFQIAKVAEVKQGDGGFELKRQDGWALFVQNPNNLPLPNVGDSVRFYGHGIGSTVRGVVCGENIYYYRTEEEDAEEHRRTIENMNLTKQRDFETNKPKWDEDLAALPEPFRARIERFMSRDSDWGWKFGPYEMFCCKEATKILNTVTDKDVLAGFGKLDIEKQKQLIPDLDYENHSGNTFGASVFLARVYLEDEDLVPKAHGALCPLVGCQDYGCYAAEVAKNGETKGHSAT